MRALFIISSYLPDIGGHEMFAHEMARRLVRDGHGVDVITGNRVDRLPGESEKMAIGPETLDGVNIFRVNRAYFLRGVLWQMARQGRSRRYNLVHSIGEGLASQVATLGKAIWRWPHLVTIQGGLLQRGFRPGARERLVRAAIGYSLRRADRVHAISRTLAQAASALGVRRIDIIPNGVNEAVFCPLDRDKLRQQHGIAPQQRVIVTVSRLIPRKGVSYVLRAVALVARDIPDLRLIIIGEGPQHQELEALARELGLDSLVDINGWVHHDHLPEYLALSDIFVSTPDFEGLGIVFIEALACGLPTIGSNVGGIPDIIQDGRNGLLVTPGDVPALAQAMVRLLQDEGLCRQLVQEGLDTVRARFRWESVYQQIAPIYQELLTDRAQRA